MTFSSVMIFNQNLGEVIEAVSNLSKTSNGWVRHLRGGRGKGVEFSTFSPGEWLCPKRKQPHDVYRRVSQFVANYDIAVSRNCNLRLLQIAYRYTPKDLSNFVYHSFLCFQSSRTADANFGLRKHTVFLSPLA